MPKNKKQLNEDHFNEIMLKTHGRIVRQAIDDLIEKNQPFSVGAVDDFVEKEELRLIKQN